MIDDTILDAMLAAGASPEVIVAAVKAANAKEEARREQKRANNAERQRRFRESIRAESEGSVTESNADNALHDVTGVTPPVLDKESFPQTPFKEINPTPRARAASARGTVLPVGWKPDRLDRTTIAGQIVERRGQGWARGALESFENHWRAKTGRDATKRDWQRTWANWVIEQDRRDGRNGQRNGNSGSIPGLGRTGSAAVLVFGADACEDLEPEPASLRRIGPGGGGTAAAASH